jgi:hypothetical protein
MKQNSFWLFLTGLTLASGLGLFVLNSLPKFSPHAAFAWSTLGFFVLFTVLAFFYGGMAARSQNKHQFTNAFMGLTMGKMLFSAMIVTAYFFLAKPSDKLFIIPFFAIYLVYTVFEVAILMKIGAVAKSTPLN